jgi:hypothetical protein
MINKIKMSQPWRTRNIPIDSQTVSSDLKFSSGIAKRHEGEDPDQYTDCLSLDALESADIDGLGVVAEPVAKVDALDHHRVPLVASQTGDSGEHIFDIAMAPVVALDLGY